MKCSECMLDAPYSWCCKLECGEHEFCIGYESMADKAICQQGAKLNTAKKKEDI